MQDISIKDWFAKSTMFLKKWQTKLSDLLMRDNYLDFLITKLWQDFENEFETNFNDNLIETIRKKTAQLEDSTFFSEKLFSILSLKKSLSESINGEASLSPEEYISMLIEEMGQLYSTFDNMMETKEFKQFTAADTIANYEELDPEEMVTLEPEIDEEIQEVGDDMVEEIEDLDNEDKKSDKKTSGFNSGLLPKPEDNKKRKKYDSGLFKIDPAKDGPVISLAGMKKKERLKATSKKPNKPSTLEAPLRNLQNSLRRVEDNIAKDYEKDLLTYLAEVYIELAPDNAEDLVDQVLKTDKKLAFLAGEEGDFKLQIMQQADLTSKNVHPELEKIMAMSSPRFLFIQLSKIREKDGPQGEYRQFDLVFEPQKRVVGFLKGKLEFSLYFYPGLVKMNVKAMGVNNLKPPFDNNSQAGISLQQNQKTQKVLNHYALNCFSSYITSILT
jgi:hypothetical protein